MTSGSLVAHPRPLPLQGVRVRHGQRSAVAVAALEGHEGWAAVAEFVEAEGKLALRRVELVPECELPQRGPEYRAMLPNPRPAPTDQIGVGHMRAVSFSSLHHAVFLASSRLQDIVAVRNEPRRQGRPRNPDAYWAKWASRYVDACAESSSPIKHLADQDSRPAEEVRDIVHQCRTRGFLTKVGRGRSGGHLTDKARKTLAAFDPGEATT
jgi:hypothetical protein